MHPLRARRLRGSAVRVVAIAVALVAASGCADKLIPISLVTRREPPIDHGLDALDVIARSSAIRDPLPVDGAGVAFADLEPALAQALVGEVARRPGLVLTVELVSAEAEYKRSRLRVVIVARATLAEREGNEFVAQTQAVCRESALVRPEHGGHVVTDCMKQLGRDVGGWLDGLPL